MADSPETPTRSFLVAEASPELTRLIEGGLAPIKLGRGQMLFDQDEVDDRLYLLDSGRLEVSVLSESGRRLALNQLPAGSVFGEIALFDPGPRTARVVALEPSALRAIRRGQLMEALAGAPELVGELLQMAGRRMRWLSMQVEEQVFLPLPARLAAKVLYLAGKETEIALSQAALADYVGATREMVSKTLSEWRRAGIVGLSRGRVTLTDPDALQRIAAAEID